MRGVLALVMVLLAGTAMAADRMRMAVTTSFENSGLAEVMLPEVLKDLDLEVQLLVVGTGQAIRLGEAGDVDAVLVHSRPAEEAFVANGHARHRTQIMYNDFVLIGPAGDPAGIAGAGSAAAAMSDIAAAGAPFVSRGDESGTHKAELALWQAAGIDAAARNPSWYRAAGAGMGATLNVASGMAAYVLADRASWLNFANKGDLALLFAGDPAMFNQYAYLPVNPALHPHVNAAAAEALEAWLLSDRAQALIDGYRLNGEQLFTYNAGAD
ncbi:substrate-binding domain-containing protein [Tropicimonas sp. IMCC34043]|uniref:substrate-binding domain-containing protein n=1 Tax=Tropicimonas sp. IMCC34043 TaxID=2248760 RepID=UPI000E23DA43|nr:substrate-binding domain-containing protein [Tropicimonas sp. IMCC34043]